MKTVIITGGSSGLGAALARGFVLRCWRTLTPTRSELDLAQPSQAAPWTRRAQRADALVCAAGTLGPDAWNVCYLSHTIIACYLKPARLVVVGSNAAFRPGWVRPTLSHTGLVEYAHAKRALMAYADHVFVPRSAFRSEIWRCVPLPFRWLAHLLPSADEIAEEFWKQNESWTGSIT